MATSFQLMECKRLILQMSLNSISLYEAPFFSMFNWSDPANMVQDSCACTRMYIDGMFKQDPLLDQGSGFQASRRHLLSTYQTSLPLVKSMYFTSQYGLYCSLCLVFLCRQICHRTMNFAVICYFTPNFHNLTSVITNWWTLAVRLCIMCGLYCIEPRGRMYRGARSLLRYFLYYQI